MDRALDPDFVCELGTAQTATRKYVRYKRGQSLLAAYALEGPGAEHDRDVYVKAHADAGRAKIQKAVSRGAGVSPDGALTWSHFPDDARLRALSAMDDKRGLRALAEAALGETVGPSLELFRLAYKPERRFVGELRVDGSSRATLRIVGRAAFREARERLGVYRSEGPLVVPEMLGSSSEHRVIGTRWIPGETLDTRLCREGAQSSDLPRVAEALHRLHAQSPRRLPHRVPEAQAANLLLHAREAGELLPSIQRRATALAATLADGLVELGPAGTALHGDFYAKQVVIAPNVVGLIDLESAARGRRSADFGQFLAHLELDVARGRHSAIRAKDIGQTLLAHTSAIPEPEVALFTAISLFERLHHPFRHADADWPERMERLLARAECLVPPRLRRYRLPPRLTRRIPVEDPYGLGHDPKMSYLREALDPARATALFRRELLHPDLELIAIRATRHKPGRRALVEYTIECDGVERVVIAKFRARGLDRRTVAVCEQLSHRLDSGPPDAPSIPVPLGVIERWNAWLQPRLPGSPLAECLGPRSVQVARRTARALARLHEYAVPTTRVHAREDELRILADRLQSAARARPDLAPRIRDLDARARAAARVIPEGRETGIHRDFYQDQVLIDGGRVCFVDLDLYARGEPELDAGNFSAHVLELALRTEGSAKAFDAARLAFEGAYLGEIQGAARERLVLYTALSLARHVYLSTRFRARRHLTEAMLELAERALAAVEDGVDV